MHWIYHRIVFFALRIWNKLLHPSLLSDLFYTHVLSFSLDTRYLWNGLSLQRARDRLQRARIRLPLSKRAPAVRAPLGFFVDLLSLSLSFSLGLPALARAFIVHPIPARRCVTKPLLAIHTHRKTRHREGREKKRNGKNDMPEPDVEGHYSPLRLLRGLKVSKTSGRSLRRREEEKKVIGKRGTSGRVCATVWLKRVFRSIFRTELYTVAIKSLVVRKFYIAQLI